MRVIVVGGFGFVGNHVADALTAAGHDVAVFDQCPLPYLQPNQAFIQGDILAAATVATAVIGHDAIYNFAGIAA